MAPVPGDDLFDQFLTSHGHETGPTCWDRSYNELQCPDCGALRDMSTATCSVCG